MLNFIQRNIAWKKYTVSDKSLYSLTGDWIPLNVNLAVYFPPVTIHMYMFYPLCSSVGSDPLHIVSNRHWMFRSCTMFLIWHHQLVGQQWWLILYSMDPKFHMPLNNFFSIAWSALLRPTFSTAGRLKLRLVVG